jgi:hypothetical protein
MVRSVKISRPQLTKLVQISFEGDKELVDTYHVRSGINLEVCVNSTLHTIEDTSRLYDLKYFKVLKDSKPIGFHVTGKDFLYSFGININWRKKDILIQWWNFICKELNNNFMCMLYIKNTRAINFLIRNGMEIINEDGKLVTLKYSKIIKS